MSYIKTFESYSFPNSLIPVADFITKFVTDKFNWWVGRKGLANWKDTFYLTSKEMGIIPSDDFPLEKVSLNISFVSTSYNGVGSSGKFIRYKDAGEVDPDAFTDLSYSKFERNKISINLFFKIEVNNEVIEIEEALEEIPPIVRHELLHSYQYFKLRKKNISQKLEFPLSFTMKYIRQKYDKSREFNRLMFVLYTTSTKEEFDAFMAEITSSNKSYVIQYSEEIVKNNKEEYITKVKNSLLKFYPDLDIDDIPIEIVSLYEDICSYHKTTPIKRILKLNNMNFDQLIGYYYDMIKLKYEIIRKKVGKINYSKKN